MLIRNFIQMSHSFTDKESICLVVQDEVSHLLQQNKTLGISKLRFLPKSSGVRPIINLGSHARHLQARNGERRRLESVNRQLQDVFLVLNYEKVSKLSYVCAMK